MKKVVIVGSGNVAQAMAEALGGNREYQLVQVWARNRGRGAAVAGGGFEGGEGEGFEGGEGEGFEGGGVGGRWGDGRWEGGSGNGEVGGVGGGNGGGGRRGEGFGFGGNKGFGEGGDISEGEGGGKGGGQSNNNSVSKSNNNSVSKSNNYSVSKSNNNSVSKKNNYSVSESNNNSVSKSNNNSVSKSNNNYNIERKPCTTTNNPAELAKADIYIISVSDLAVGEVSGYLNFGNALVAHTAGSVGIDELSAKIENRAVIYPLQTFTSGRKVDFSEVPLFVEGSNPEALEAIKLFASALSRNVIEASSPKRLNLHTAAVFASNFTNAMYVAAEEILTHSQLDPNLLRPLILETAAKAAKSICAAQVQTGPARRGDTATMEKHLAQLTDKPELKEIYKLISTRIWETSKKI